MKKQKNKNVIKLQEKTTFITCYLETAQEIALTLCQAGFFVKIIRNTPRGTVPEYEVLVYQY